MARHEAHVPEVSPVRLESVDVEELLAVTAALRADRERAQRGTFGSARALRHEIRDRRQLRVLPAAGPATATGADRTKPAMQNAQHWLSTYKNTGRLMPARSPDPSR